MPLLSERCDVHYLDGGKEELVKLEILPVFVPAQALSQPHFPSFVLAPDPSSVRAVSEPQIRALSEP